MNAMTALGGDIALGTIRDALDGAVPGVIATCSAEGVPNIAFLSQVFFVDERHVALSYQFFNQTRRNILANPQAVLTVVQPQTARMFRLRIRYLRTEASGALFERMQAHLEGIASYTGMAGVFRLLGSDVYEVQAIEPLRGGMLPAPPAPPSVLAALRRAIEALSACSDAGQLIERCLDVLQTDFGMEHAMVLMLDAARGQLYTVGSRGYAASGVGSEIALGQGVIGVCARERTAIRITHFTNAYRYSLTQRDSAAQSGFEPWFEPAIAYPGLAEPHSQLGVPIVHGERLLGVLFVESRQDMRFGYDEEDALVVLSAHLGGLLERFDQTSSAAEETQAGAVGLSSAPSSTPVAAPADCDSVLRVRRFAGDAVFLGEQYLIKGVAGAILWRLIGLYLDEGRTSFSNKELRLDPAIRLPEVVDNLEARLILLRRRLDEHGGPLRLHKVGRGQLALQVGCTLEREDHAG